MCPMSSRFARAQTKSDLRKLKSLAKSLSLLTLDHTYTTTTHLQRTTPPPIHQNNQPHRLTTINTRPPCSSASSPPLPQQLNPPSGQQQPHPLDHNSSAQQHPQSNKRLVLGLRDSDPLLRHDTGEFHADSSSSVEPPRRPPSRQLEAKFTREMIAVDRKSTRLNSSHSGESRMPSSA